MNTIEKMDFENISSADEKLTIDELNNDCLIEIFEKLTPIEKLNLELVCKRWNDVGKQSWNNLKSLKLDTKLNDEYDFTLNKEFAFNIIINIVKRCGTYLKHLKIKDLSSYTDLNCSLLLKFITNYCRNINSFYFNGIDCDHTCIEEQLSLLMQQNKKLSSITLVNTNLNNGDCFSSICKESLKEIHLSCVNNIDAENLYLFISKLKNLEKFSLYSHLTFDLRKLLLAFTESQCKNLSEFNLLCGHGEFNHELKQLFLEQTKLCKLRLSYLVLSADFLDSLPVQDTLKELEISCNDELSYCIYNFKNLTSFICKIRDLTDVFVRNLTKCTNLEKIELRSIQNYSLTSYGEKCFKEFKKLESFAISCNLVDINIDNILKSIAECKNLKKIKMHFCIFTADVGLKHISSLTNLNYLEIIQSSITNSEFINLIEKLHNLNEIYVEECFELSLDTDLLKAVSELKMKRQDLHLLKMIFFHFDLERNLKKNPIYLDEYPLVLLQDAQTLMFQQAE